MRCETPRFFNTFGWFDRRCCGRLEGGVSWKSVVCVVNAGPGTVGRPSLVPSWEVVTGVIGGSWCEGATGATEPDGPTLPHSKRPRANSSPGQVGMVLGMVFLCCSPLCCGMESNPPQLSKIGLGPRSGILEVFAHPNSLWIKCVAPLRFPSHNCRKHFLAQDPKNKSCNGNTLATDKIYTC